MNDEKIVSSRNSPKRLAGITGIAGAIVKPIEQTGSNTAGVVGRMVWLKARGQASRQADGVAKRGHDTAFFCYENQVLVAHQFRYGSCHLQRDAGSCRSLGGAVNGVRQQPVAKVIHRQMAQRRKRLCVMAVDDQACDFVILLEHHDIVEEHSQRQRGECHLRHYTLFGAGRGDTGEQVARARQRRLCRVRLQIGETICGGAKDVSEPVWRILHGRSRVTKVSGLLHDAGTVGNLRLRDGKADDVIRAWLFPLLLREPVTEFVAVQR